LLLLAAAAVAARAHGWRRIWNAWGQKGRRAAPLLTLWIAVPLVLFSLARTHHHWYLDPVYPALAAVTAWALLTLFRRISPERRSWAFLGLFLVPLALCEARALDRVLVRDRMPDPQRFLISLKERRLELGPDLHAAFPLRHSERFILEAIDGYRVIEGRGDGPPAGARPDMALLVRKSLVPGQLAPAPGSEVLAETRGFILYGNPLYPEIESARLRMPEDWKLYRFRRHGRGRGIRRS
jgi:hypothetical protein